MTSARGIAGAAVDRPLPARSCLRARWSPRPGCGAAAAAAHDRLCRDRRRSRYEPITAYGRLILKIREHPFAGAQVGLDDAKVLARVLKTDFALERITREVRRRGRAGACMQAHDIARHPFLHRRCAGGSIQAAGRLPCSGRDVLLFNATAPDDTLRRDLCAKEIVTRLPSLSMSMDGLVQYLVSRKWRDFLVLQGPQPADAHGAKAFEPSAKKFGARSWPPARVQGRHRSARARAERSGAAQRHQPRLRCGLRRRRGLRFRPAGALSHRQAAAGGRQHRSRARGLALDLGAQRCAAGEFPLSEAHRPPHGRRRLGGVDGGQDGGAGGACARARPTSRRSAISSSAKCTFDGNKGLAHERAAAGIISCARRCCWRRPIPSLRARRSKASCTRPMISIRSATTSRKRRAS